MSGKAGRGFYDLEIYRRYETLSDALWSAVDGWEGRHQRTIGDQMLRAVDSIGANIAEGVGRGHYKDTNKFLLYARGSMAETQHWIRVAIRRRLIAPEAVSTLRDSSITLHRQLNAFLRAQTPRQTTSNSDHSESVSEECAIYQSSRRVSRFAVPRAKSQEPRAERP